MSKALNWLSARKLAKGFAKGKFTPLAVAEACLAQVKAHESALNAMALVDEKTTLAMAEQANKRWRAKKPLGPMDGVPVLIKDLLLTRGWPTLRGSRTVERAGAWDTDAPSVARLREGGLVFLGLTTTPEYGWKGVTDSPLTGITRNPWNTALTPGGSSGGSAAALAAGYGPLALGTDGGGSIRIPAGFSGVFGHKPSYGRVPAWPASPFGTVAHVGPMTRSVRDAADFLALIAQPDARDWHSLPFADVDYGSKLGRSLKGLRFAFSPTLGFVEVDAEVAALVAAAVDVLRDRGAKVELVDPGIADPASTFRVLWWAGAKAALGALPADKKALLEPALADVVQQAAAISLDEYQAAIKARAELGAHMRGFMQRYDALLTPTLPLTAFTAGQLQPGDESATSKWVNWTPFTYPFNLTQQPAASVPCGFTKAGLPAGLQVVGRMFDDATVLRICAAYERATPWHKARPAGFTAAAKPTAAKDAQPQPAPDKGKSKKAKDKDTPPAESTPAA